ncbi:MAG: Calcineurin-like phosphoesterase [Acidimicrobiales bacterium]|nr:Calcineurin-like phosphoesterase [Acidimicrobiales bacterium]
MIRLRRDRSPADPRPVAHRVVVFSVEDTTAQITWSALGPGPVRVRAADTTVDLQTDGGPGAALIKDLPPNRLLTVTLEGEGVPGTQIELKARTLAPPPGAELVRVATISDLHLGSRRFGYFGTIVEHPIPAIDHPERCAAAALAAAVDWGAADIVVKGDVTDRARPHEWRTFRRLTADLPLPVHVIPGNHDVRATGVDARHAGRAFGLDITTDVATHDRPGLRLILVNTTVPGLDRGHLDEHTPAVLDALADADPAAGVLIAVHHQLQPHRVAEGWPWGVPRAEARRFLEAVGARHRHVLVTSGHTHRHRRWGHAGVTITQVGSTKDHPGVWAGYVVHEGGMRQVVRRIDTRDILDWTERTRDAALGLWGHVAPGRLDARCFTLDWHRPQPGAGGASGGSPLQDTTR